MEQMTKINTIGHFSSRVPLKKVSDKILLGNNVTHILEKIFSENVYNYSSITINITKNLYNWRCGVVVIATAQLHSTKPELRFCAGPNLVCGMPKIRDGEDLCQWPRLEIRLNAFCRSTIPQKQFITIGG